MAESVRRMGDVSLSTTGDTPVRGIQRWRLTAVARNVAFAVDQLLLFWPPYQATDASSAGRLQAEPQDRSNRDHTNNA